MQSSTFPKQQSGNTGMDILRNVIVSGYSMLQSNKSKMFREYIIFLLLTNCLCGQMK